MMVETDVMVLKGTTSVADANTMMDDNNAFFVVLIHDDSYYLYTKYDVAAASRNSEDSESLADALMLDFSDAVAEVLPKKFNPKNLAPDVVYVIVDQGEVIGCIPVDNKLEEAGFEPQDPIILPGNALVEPIPNKRNAEKEESGSAFSAYPSISDPGQVNRGESFKLYVGFSDELDSTLRNVQEIHIENPQEDDTIYVVVMAQGASVDEQLSRPLPLQQYAQTVYNCRVHDDATEVDVKALFLYKNQPIGAASRTIVVAGQQQTHQEEEDKKGCSLSLAGIDFEKGKVDITLTVRHDRASKTLQWHIQGNQSHIQASETTSIDNPKMFAHTIQRELRAENFKDKAAHNALLTMGEEIAELLPDAFFEMLEELIPSLNRLPKILIWTDEAYIPWELAVHTALEINDDLPPFFGAQMVVGRWWLHQTVVSPPPTSLQIEEIKALAADYEFSSGQTALEEALKEKKFLEEEFNAVALTAKKETVLALSDQENRVNGLLVHMALHGLSDPRHDEQKIILKDGSSLSPRAMLGRYKCGQIPPISFLFMNACQVGTAGESLGQASGFPGIMLKKGMLGFIAPLWEVHDVQAREFAEHFYVQCLEEQRPIAEVLQELRSQYEIGDSLTSLAYMYYGHPGMQLIY